METSTVLPTRKNRVIKLGKALILSFLLLAVINSEAFSQCTVSGVSGSGFLFANQCAPVTTGIYYEFTFGIVAPPQASYQVLYVWGDGNSEVDFWPVITKDVFGTTYYYVRAEKPHNYVSNLCEYEVRIVLVDAGVQCPDSRQIQIVGNWHEDDVAAANGIIALNPTPRKDVCEGQPLIDFQFTDATRFACNVQQNSLLQKPNHTLRYQQYIYGTNPVAGRGIPNLYIKVGTAQTIVYLTQADGSPVPNNWNVHPVTGAIVANYTTPSGRFEGPKVAVPVDAVTGTYALSPTYRISFDGVGTVFQDQFQVTVRNWNVCNPVVPNEATSLIYIVDAPNAPTPNNQNICVGDIVPSLTVGGAAGVTAYYWYSNAALTIPAPGSNNTNTYITGIGSATPSTTTFYVTQVVGGVNACVSPATPVTLTINPLPINTFTVSDPIICLGATATISVSGSVSGTSYQLRRDSDDSNVGSAVAGTGAAINLSVTPAATTVYNVLATIVATGCTSELTDKSTVTVNPQPVGPTINTKSPNLASVCVGQNVYATFNPGTGGVGCSDAFQYRFDGAGGWSVYTPGSNLSTTGHTSVEIQGRRANCTAGAGCTGTNWTTLASWTVNAQPVGPTLNSKTPNLAAVCTGTNVSATFNAGSGGVGCTDDFQYRFDGTGGWSAYTPGNNLSTTGHTLVEIQGRRASCTTGAGCTGTPYVLLASWIVSPQPVAPTLITKTPNLATVCAGQLVSATFNSGSGGVGCSDEYNYRFDGTPLWSVYVPGNDLNTTGHTSVQIRVRRSGCTTDAGCTGTAWVVLASWLVNPQPIGPTLNTKTPNLAAVCEGQNVSATFNAGSGGVGCSDQFRYSFDGSGSWLSYTAGTNLSTTGHTSVEIQGRRASCTAGAGCTGTAWTTLATWNVNPLPADITGTPSVCVTTTTTLSNATPGGTWSSLNTAVATINAGGLVTGITAGTVEIRYTLPTGCYKSVIVTVNPSAPGAAGVISGLTNVCYGQSGVVYSITAVPFATNYVWTVPAGVTIVSGQGTIALTVDFAPGAASPRTIQVYPENGCGTGGTSTRVVSIYNQLNGGTIDADQTICHGGDVAAFTSSSAASGGAGVFTYTWQWTTNMAAVPGDASWTNIPASNSDTWNYGTLTSTTRFIRRAVEGTCSTPVYSNILLITVRPALNGGTIASAQTVCYGTDVAAFTSTAAASGGTGAFTYTWQWTNNGGAVPGDANWTDIPMSNSLTWDYGTLTLNTRFVRRAVEGTCTTPVFSNVILIIARPVLNGGAISSSQTICYGADVAAFTSGAAATGGGGVFTYTWQWTTNTTAVPGDASWTDIPASNSTTYNHGTLNATTRFVRRAIDATCTTPVFSNVLTITVSPQLNGGVIASDQTICYGGDVAAFTSTTAATGGAGVFTYTWQLTTNMAAVPGDANWTDIPASNTAAYNYGTLTATTKFVRKAVEGTCTTPVYSNELTITVRPQLNGGVIASDQTICYGGDVADFTSTTAASGGAGVFNYTWQLTTNMAAIPGDVNWTDIPASNSLTWDYGTLTATTKFVRKAVEGTCTTPVYSNVLTITVRPQLNGGVIASDQTICYGGDVAAFISTTAATGGAGVFTYTWQLTTNMAAVPGDANWTDIPASNSTTWNYGTLTSTTKFVRRAVEGTCTTPVYSNELILTVRPQLNGGTIDANQTICSGGDVAAFMSTAPASGGAGLYTYTWQYTTNLALAPGDPAWNNIAASNSETWDYGTLTATTRFIRKAVDATCSTPVYSNILLITVRPALAGGSIGNDQIICSGADVAPFVNLVAPSGGDNTFTYLWQYTTNMAAIPGDGNWTDINPSNSLGYDYGTLSVKTKFIRKSSDISCITPVYSNMVTVDVNPLPITSVISGPTLLCQGATNQVYSVVNTSGSTYTWTYPPALTSSSPTGLYFIIADAPGLTVAGDKITVVEKFSATTQCVGLPVELFVTVSPIIPGGNITGPASVCNGATGVVYSVPNNAGSSYNWIVPAGASITSPPGLNTITVNFSLALTGSVSVLETTAAGCLTPHNPKTVVINPLPAVYNVTAPPAYCSGDPGVTVTLSNSESGVNYQLFKNAVADGAPLAGTSGSPLTWPNRLVGSYYVVATNATTTCTQQMNGTAVVTINNVTGGTIGTTQTICQATAPAPFTNVAAATGGGSVTYQWQSSTDNFVTPVNIVGATSAVYTSGALTNDTWFRRIAYSTMGTSVCSALSNVILVTVDNFSPGTITADQTICEATIPAQFISGTAPSGDGGTFSYQWKSSTDGITYSNVTGGNAEDYTSASLSVDTWFKRFVTSTLNGNTCTEETNAVKVTVVNFTPGVIGANQTICEGTAPALLTGTAASGDGTFAYLWELSTNSGGLWTPIGGATSQTYGPGALAVDTWYRRKATSNLNVTCIQYSNTVIITVNSFDPGSIATTSTTICEGTVPAAFTSVTPTGVAGAVYSYVWQNSSDGSTWVNIPSATSEVYASPALTQDTHFRRLVTSTLNGNQCTEPTAAVLIAVNNLAAGTIAGVQTVCEGDIPATALTSSGTTTDGALGLQWQYSTDNEATWANVAVGGTGATYTPAAALTMDTWYKLVVTSTFNTVPCVEETNVIKVTVNNFNPGSIGTDQTICEGTSAAPITSVTPTGDGTFAYKWYSSSDNGLSWNLIAGNGETYSPGMLAADTWYKREVTSTFNSKLCIEETNVVKILVNNLLPGSITADQTICDNSAPAAFGSVAATGDGTITYQWENSTDGINFTAIGSATSDVYTSPALTQDTWFRRAATSATLAPSTCTEYSNIVKVTVVNFTPGSVSSDQTICEGATPAIFTSVAAAGDGTFAYLWESSTAGAGGPWTPIATATSPTYGPGALTVDTWYRRKATSNLNAACFQYSNVVTVTVINFLPGSVSTTSTTICEGVTPAAFTSVAPSGDGAYTYQWQFSTNGTDYINIPSATSDIYAPGALTVDTWYRRQVISTLNGSQCTQYTTAVLIPVNNLTPGTIAGAQTICENDIPPVALTSAGTTTDGTLGLQWQYSTDNEASWANVAVGGTAATYTFTASLTLDTWYKLVVTSTFNTVPCVKETNVLKVTVNNFVPGSISADQTICDGTAPAPFASVSPTGDGVFTYQWQSSLNGTVFNNIPGAQSETYNAGILTQDTWYKRLVTSTLSGNSCTEETNVVKVTVVNFVPGSITADQTVCEGEDPAAFGSVTPTGDGAFFYQWQSSLDGFVFTDISGATNETYDPGVLAQDTWYKRIVKATLLGRDCFKETNVVRVTVINFVSGSIGSDQTICEASVPSTFTSVDPTGDGVFTYQWQDSPTGAVYTDILGATSASYTSPALSSERWFRRVVKASLNGKECFKNTNFIKVTINYLATGISTADQTICEGTAPTTFNSTPPTGTGVLSYQWQSSIDGTNFSNITGATGASYTAGNLLQDTWFRLSVISTLNGNSCTEMTNPVKTTVINFMPGATSADQTICENGTPAPISGTLPTGDGVFTYQWQESSDGTAFSNILGATLQNYSPGVLTQDMWYKRVVTSTLDLIPCVKETNVVKVTVNNFIPGSISADETICEGSFPAPFTSVTPTGDGVFTYQWQRSTDGTNFTDIGGAIFENYASPALLVDTWFKRKVTSTIGLNSCIEETNIVKVTVNNLNPGSIAGAQTVCEGGAVAAFTSGTPVTDGVVGYQWRSSIDGVNYTDITGATSETYASASISEDTWFKRVVSSTLTGVTCYKETNVIKVTVNNVNGGTIISDQTICDGGNPVAFMTIVNGSGDGAVTFQWQSSTDGATFTDLAGANLANYDAGVLLVDTWYKRITKSVLSTVECSEESNVVKITINEVTGGTIAADQTICYGATPATINSTDDGTYPLLAVPSYQWQTSTNSVTWVNISGATSVDYTPGALLTSTYYKRVIISILNGIVCTSESNVVKITINPLPVAMLTGGATICPAQSSNLMVTIPVGTGPFFVDIQSTPGVPINLAGYVSGTNIPVSPAVTTTYTLLRVRDANGCEVLSPSANLGGTATVIVSTPPSIDSFTPSLPVCEFTPAAFSVSASGTNPTYQWQVSTDGGTSYSNITDGGTYFGTTSPAMQIFSSVRTMNGYVYHVVVSGCGTDVISASALFTVNTAPELTLHPKDTTICFGAGAIMEADADGTSVTWQWQVNKGSGFVNVIDDAYFSGSTNKILTITNAQATFNNWIFRARATGVCGVPVNTSFGRLRVINAPVATLQPAAKEICETGSTSFLANGSGYIELQWQFSTDGGTTWTNVTDDAYHVGAITNQLSIVDAPVTLNGRRYHLGLIGECTTTYTNGVTLTVNPNPLVLFPADLNTCGGTNLILNGNPAGGTTPYTQHRWTGDVGPLNSYTIQSPTFNSLITGTYNLTYTVKDSKGCSATDDIAVTVDSPDATFTMDLESGCTPLTVTFTKDMAGLSKFWWDFGDGSPLDSLNANPVHTFKNTNPASLEYRSVKLKVMSPGGCFDTFTSTVTVYPTVNAAFTASDTVVCSGSSLIFTTSPGASKYFWDFGDGQSGYSPTESASHTYSNFTSAPQVLTVKLTTTSFYSCSDDTAMTITVMPVPLPQFTAVPPTQVFNAAGNLVTFTDQTNPGTWTYLWNFGDGSTSTVQNPTHTYTSLGTFNVVLKVSNSNCSDSIVHQVSVLPKAPIADFDTIPDGCEPLTISINNTSLNTEAPGTTYRWDFGDGSISTAKNPEYSYFDPGIYRVELTVTGPGGVSSKSQVVKVFASPRAYFELSPTFVFVNDEKVRGYNLSQGADSYLWEFGDGDTSKVKEPFHKYMEAGVYDVTLWAYKDNGNGNICTDKFVLSPGVTVEPAGDIRFATVFRPNTGGEENVDVGNINSENLDRFFYPPIKERVIDYKLQVFNRLGVLIFESRDINIPWNGYYRGQLCTQGVYVWYVEGKYANGQPFKKVGDVTLLH